MTAHLLASTTGHDGAVDRGHRHGGKRMLPKTAGRRDHSSQRVTRAQPSLAAHQAKPSLAAHQAKGSARATGIK